MRQSGTGRRRRCWPRRLQLGVPEAASGTEWSAREAPRQHIGGVVLSHPQPKGASGRQRRHHLAPRAQKLFRAILGVMLTTVSLAPFASPVAQTIPADFANGETSATSCPDRLAAAEQVAARDRQFWREAEDAVKRCEAELSQCR